VLAPSEGVSVFRPISCFSCAWMVIPVDCTKPDSAAHIVAEGRNRLATYMEEWLCLLEARRKD
jgi:hypothetical protein